MSAFDRWFAAVQALLTKYGLDPDVDPAYYYDAYHDGLSPEEAVMEDACLTGT